MKKLETRAQYEIKEIYPESGFYAMRKNLIGAAIKLSKPGNIEIPRTNLSISTAVRHAYIEILDGTFRGKKLCLTNFLARKIRFEDTCECAAYPFPHRLGGGACEGDLAEAFCSACRLPCKPLYVDEGIGPYEYWGAKECQTIMAWVSDCCHEHMFEDSLFSQDFTGEAYHE
jgi:hypothetical protein